MLNKEIGRRYREVMLEPGASKTGFMKVKEFLGREPNEDAFLKIFGFE